QNRPGALAKIVPHQRDLDKGPAPIDIMTPAVSQIAVQGLRPRGTKKDSTQQPEAMRMLDQQAQSIDGVQRSHYTGVKQDLPDTRIAQHSKPQEHDRAERPPDNLGPKSLKDKKQQQDHQHDLDDKGIPGNNMLLQSFYHVEPLDGGGNGDGRGNDTVRQQRPGADDGGVDQELPIAADQCIERENAAFPMVIRLQCNDHIFERRLQGQGPEDTRNGAEDQSLVDPTPFGEDRLQCIQRRSTDVSIYNAEGNEDACSRSPL